MPNATSSDLRDATLIRGVLERVTHDLGAVMGCEFALERSEVERARTRPAGAGKVHISFKLGLSKDGGPMRFGSLLVPLPEAITMASLLLMAPEETLDSQREAATLDPSTKDAMLEIGNMVAAASSTALAALGAAGWTAHSEGCQGVRADVRPAFPYEEGSELVVGRSVARIGPYPSFGMILMLPALD